jgi:hypothetical protein
MNSICIHKFWGLESSRTGGLADTRVYKEVVAPKFTIKQNSICLWWLWRYMRGWRMIKGVLGLCSNPRMCPYWAQLDTLPIRPKYDKTTPWQIMYASLFRCFPWNKMVFGHETRSIGKVILLSFHPYKECPKRSLYVISVMILVWTIPGIWINLSKSY